MKTRILGKDLKVSAVGLGCMGMSHAYGPASDEKEMSRLLAQAVELGYTFFDTAEVYGTPENPHHNEELLGRALKPFGSRIVLATKCGIRFDETSDAVNKPLIPDGRPETIKRSAEGSLKRLQTDCLDLYYIHRVDPEVPIEETAGAMAELIQQGKITHWGISEANEEILRRAHKVCPVTAVQNGYSMMYRDYEEMFGVLEELQVGFVAFSPLANGLLSARYDQNSHFQKGTDYRSAMPQFSAEGMEQNRQLLERLQEIAREKNATPAQISLAWMMAKKPWIVPIPGTRKYDRLAENAGAAALELTEDEVKELDHMLNRSWTKNLSKGTYGRRRLIQTIVVVLILLSMLGSMVSGIILSRHIFRFLPIRGGVSAARILHMLCAYWGFVLMSLHLGFHWNMILGMMRRKFGPLPLAGRRLVRILGLAVGAYGIYAFGKREIGTYMFLQSHFVFFDYEEPFVWFLLDYIAVMGLFVLAGCGLWSLLGEPKGKKACDKK